MPARDRTFLLLAAGVIVATALIEWFFGRLPFGPDGHFGFWEGDTWSSGCSQRVADAYSFSHIIHGMAFYGLLWLAARRLPVSARYFIAVLLEAGWELLENSPIIINRYRQATMALGYEGDSILNSTSDILMMSLGFFLAWKLRPSVTVALVVIMEIGCLFWIRDNLTLNIIMLIHPIPAIKEWQMKGHPAAGFHAPGLSPDAPPCANTHSKRKLFSPNPGRRSSDFSPTRAIWQSSLLPVSDLKFSLPCPRKWPRAR